MRYQYILIGLLVIGLAWLAYLPGLHGGFLFDDFGNLPTLGATGPVDTWPTFWRYITSGIADPIGRPLTLLSFLLDAHNWPAAPYPFKRTNLILHLLNGTLLALLLRQLGRLAYQSHANPVGLRIDMAAVLGAALWLLHPLLVSTTLYIVQREAMLPATFTLAGLLLWLHGRRALLDGCSIRGLMWVALGLGGCTALGVLSKANGILLPALALVIEYVLLQSISLRPSPHYQEQRTPPAYRWAMRLFGWLPAALVAGYLLESAWKGFVHGIPAVRPWTLGQRLLTEARVLIQYLDLLWLPRPFTPGLFNDQFHASTTLLTPWTTLPSVLGVVGLIIGAWLLRRRWPVLAMVTLFYFVGQSIESSTIPLELYFEHRNYLPAMLMFWPLALWLCGVRQACLPPSEVARPKPPSTPHTDAEVAIAVPLCPRAGSPATALDATPSRTGTSPSPRRQPLTPRQTDLTKAALASMLLAGLALMTFTRAQLWGNTLEQGQLWATLNPRSPRAQANAALLEMTAGHSLEAATRLQGLLNDRPDEVQLALNLIGAHCVLGALPPRDLSQAEYAMAHTRDPGSLLAHWFEPAIAQALHQDCPGLTTDSLHSLLDAGLTNRHLVEVNGRKQDLLHLQGSLALVQNEPAKALSDFNAALDQNLRPGIALEQAALLGAAGYPREGLAHLDHFERVKDRRAAPSFGMPWLHSWVLRRQRYWPKEFARLRDTLRADSARQSSGTP